MLRSFPPSSAEELPDRLVPALDVDTKILHQSGEKNASSNDSDATVASGFDSTADLFCAAWKERKQFMIKRVVSLTLQ